jgi:hypothetical protein
MLGNLAGFLAAGRSHPLLFGGDQIVPVLFPVAPSDFLCLKR